MKHLGTILALILSITAVAAKAEERIALVVGNGTYTAVTSLTNPVPDSELIAASLEELGFKVTLVTDGSLLDMKRGISQFGRDLRAAGQDATGLFYYAGHGVQSFGTNYLLPTDTELTNPADLDLVALEASSILRQMYSARNRTNIFILDACRNNPFENIPEFDDNGLAEMKAPRGTFLAYATSPGSVAYDGEGVNSPFTTALATEMIKPGQPIEQAFRNVRIRVLETTNGQQTPWDTSSLTGEFQFNPAVLPTAEELADKRMWEGVRQTQDPLQIMLFLRANPDSPYQAEARGLLAELVTGSPATQNSGTPERQAAPEPVAPSPVIPQADEQSLIVKAQTTGAAEDYQAYLDQFPDGVFAELARTELQTLEEKAQQPAPSPEPPAQEVAAAEPEVVAPPPAEPAPTPDTPVTFTGPLAVGSDAITGRSIAELIKGSPLFPPVEGLPESYWKEQTCSNCHQWTRDALCTQAQVYLAETGERSLSKDHPYGGTFKQNLRAWASNDCN